MMLCGLTNSLKRTTNALNVIACLTQFLYSVSCPSEVYKFSIKNDATDNPQINGALAQMMGDPAAGGRGLLIVGPVIWSDPPYSMI